MLSEPLWLHIRFYFPKSFTAKRSRAWGSNWWEKQGQKKGFLKTLRLGKGVGWPAKGNNEGSAKYNGEGSRNFIY